MKLSINKTYYFLLVLATIFFVCADVNAQDSTAVQSDSLKYPFKGKQKGSLYLSNYKNLEVVYDHDRGHYIFVEKVGDYYIEHPLYMTQKEYKDYSLKKDIASYFKEKTSAFGGLRKNKNQAQKNLLPKYYVRSEFFENIFGGNEIEVNPQGSVLVKMGVLYQRIENPQLSEQNRSNTTFDFDQEISASLNAKVGSRLRVNAAFDTQSTFNFQNQIKLEYTPTEDDIIRKIEVGDVSMPIQSSLISGAQNLFGVKTQLQFGRTTVTGVFAQQRSQSQSVTAEGGSTITEFELRASDYDENRHFFLSQEFRNNFNDALSELPLIKSSKFITRVEVWVTNRNNTTENVRNIVALGALGEADSDNFVSGTSITVNPSNTSLNPRNGANSLNNLLTENGSIREISSVDATMRGLSLKQGSSYSMLENARQLIQGVDFTLHPQLGYISLNGALADSDILAVAYEYTDTRRTNPENPQNPNVFRVGELSADGVTAPKNLVVKLLRSEILNPELPIWKLMMKNIYKIQGAYQLEQDGFRFEVLYRDDQTGVPVNFLQNAKTVIGAQKVSEIPLLNLLKLDLLDGTSTSIAGGDGYFDFVEGVTVNSNDGLIIFPTVEPFGGKEAPTAPDPLTSGELGEVLTDAADEKFIFEELYTKTRTDAQNKFQNKDKYFLKGYFKSTSLGGISAGFGATKGSVRVTSGGRELVEGADYIISQSGSVEIINENLIASNAPINITSEVNNGFSQQNRRFMGVDVQHIFSDKFAIGGTLVNLNERPFTQKPQFGAEPVNNTMVGFNVNYETEVPKFTKWVNKLPNIDTDVKSNFSVRAEAAYLLPGSPKGINLNGEASSYIDDFEGSQIPIDISSPRQWFLASVPQNGDVDFTNINVPNAGADSKLSYGAERSRLAWYSIDRLFYGSRLRPTNIDDNELSRAEVRRVGFNELFPQLQLDVTQSQIISTFDLAYYPNERGSYNFNPNINNDGVTYNDNLPQDKWGGVMRALTNTNFQQANIEYIQFWLMDPYENYSISADEGGPATINSNDFGGDLYFNLGNISEDILNDNRKMFENGLPGNGVKVPGVDVDETAYSLIPKKQSLIYAFTEENSERLNQDIGLDGRNNEEERAKFGAISPVYNSLEDPSNDDFQFFRGGKLDSQNASVLQRYKKYNNTQGNSPTLDNSPESFPTAATSFPDIEDINRDQTMSQVESYYQYKVSLRPNDLILGKNNIVDVKEGQAITLQNGQTITPKWYQFRIPVTSGKPINGISNFNSIRFIRMYLTQFKVPVVLRFGELQLVRGDWRRYLFSVDENNPIQPPEPLTADQDKDFEVGVVNLEQNERKKPFPYKLPPGVRRERLQSSTTVQEQNEQSLLVKVNNLAPKEVRTVFKNTSYDMRMFNKIKMFIHAASVPGQAPVSDSDLTAILKLGSDTNDNYYQIELPLRITKTGEISADSIWKNNLDTKLKELGLLKVKRSIGATNELYPSVASKPNARIRVKGSPNLANIRTLMIGVRNDASTAKTAEFWFNELRVSDFDNEGGWAAVLNADANFADFADVSLSARANSQGFGALDQKISQRSQEDVKQYDVITNVNLGQLLPKKVGVKLPLNYSFSEEFRDPKWDPKYQDVTFKAAKEAGANSNNSRDYTKRRSVNLINVRKERTNPEKKQRFYDIENLSLSYSFSETYRRNYNITKFLDQNVRTSATYNHSFKPFTFQPLKKWKFLNKKKYLALVKDFNINLLPSSISANSNIIRSYNSQLNRSLTPDLPELPELKQHRYFFNWDYAVAYNLTKSLQFTFKAANNYVYDDFTDSKEARNNTTLFSDFFNTGRPNNYHQTLDANYKIPLNKIPIFNFVDATYKYKADFDWQAPSKSFTDKIGNIIQNANTHTLSANLNMTRFYKKIGLLDLAKKKRRKSKSKSKKKGKDAKRKTPPTPTIGNRNITQRNRSKMSTGQKVLQGVVDAVTSVKSIRVSYSENNGTILPGYRPEIGFLGRNNYENGYAPSLGFVFGSQRDIRNTAISNNWLVQNDDYSKVFSNRHNQKLDINANVKPFRNLNIELSANKTYASDKSQQIDIINNGGNQELNSNFPVNENGNFSISYFMLPAAFDGNGDATFEKFKQNRAIIAQRLANTTGKNISGFGENSSQVLLPAFLATYSGQNPSKAKLGAFRNIPIPNWRLSYKGFMQYKWFKKRFRSFTIDHRYNATYSIIGFTNNLQYAPNATDINGNYQSEKLFTGINLVEEFNPLVRVDMKMRNNFSIRAELKRDKALSLNLNNNTITEVRGKEYVFGLGYRIKDVKLKIKTGPTTTRFKGDINLKADIAIREDATVIRSIDINNNQVTGGQKFISVKFNADYALNKNLMASFYYDQNSSRFLISNTFPRNSISGGISLRYTIGN